MPTHQEMLDAIADDERAWSALRRRYWQLVPLREAVRLTYAEMTASQ